MVNISYKIRKKSGCLIVYAIIVILVSNQALLTKKSSFFKCKNTSNKIIKNFIINNWGVANYYYHTILVDNNLAYLFDYWSYRMGVYNLTNLSNPQFISEHSILDPQNNTNGASLFLDGTIIGLENNIFYMINTKSINNTYNIKFTLMELQNYSEEILLYEESYNITITDYNSRFINVKNNILYLSIIDNIVNTEKNYSFYNVTLFKFNITNPYSTNLIYIQNILTENNKTINKLTNPYNRCFINENFLFLYREFQNYSAVQHPTNPEDSFSYGNLKIIKIEDNSLSEICSEINFTRGALSNFILKDNILYRSIMNFGFDVYNCSNPYYPIKIGEYHNGITIRDFQIADDKMYLFSSEIFELLDITNLDSIKKQDRYNPREVEFIAGTIIDSFFVLTQTSSYANQVFLIFDCSNPKRIKPIYPEGIIAEYWIILTIISPIIAIVLLLFIVIIGLLRKKKNLNLMKKF